MTFYLLIALLLFILSLASVKFEARRDLFAWIASGTLLLFAGLRHETGYDWPFYEAYFKSIVGFGTALCEGIPPVPILVEPLYMLINMAFKTLGAESAHLFFFVSLFNISAIHYVSSSLTHWTASMWVPYYGFVFLMAQMTMVRQGLASSIILLALLLATKNKKAYSLFLLIVAATIHVSSIVFLPIIFLRRINFRFRWLIPILLIGLPVMALKINLHFYLFTFLNSISPEWISAKLFYYINLTPKKVSVGSAGLILYHLLVIVLIKRLSTEEERKDQTFNIALWLTILNLTAHLFLAGIPSIWNRLMFVTIPWQTIALLRLNSFSKSSTAVKISLLTCSFVISLSALIYSLNKPSALPFKPYLSVVHSLIGIHSDGQPRVDYMLNKIEEMGKREFPAPNLIQESRPIKEVLPSPLFELSESYCQKY